MTVRCMESTEIIKQPLNSKCEDGHKLSKVWFQLLFFLTTATLQAERHHQTPTLTIATYRTILLSPLDSTTLNTPPLLPMWDLYIGP